MCKIGININATTPNGTSLTSTALGRYRPAGGGATDWVNFTISLANPETPDITQIGSYELQVNVTNNIAATSAWSNTATFSVSSNCGTTPTTTCTEYVFSTYSGADDQTWLITGTLCSGAAYNESGMFGSGIPPKTVCLKNGTMNMQIAGGTGTVNVVSQNPCSTSTTTTTANSITWNVYALIPVDPAEICTTITESIAYSAPNTTFTTGTKLWVDPAMTIPMTMFDRIRLMGSARAYYMSGQTIGSSLTC